MINIDYHADDYAISPNNSKRLIELVNTGKLNSFSIIANMGCYKECMDILRSSWDTFNPKPDISIHLNLIDGYSLSSADKSTILNNSWGQLFLKSLFPFSGKKEYKKRLTQEIKAQIQRVYSDIQPLVATEYSSGLRIDSHVHTHMIPMVFDCMIDALNELELLDKVEYVRNSKEPLFIFFKTKGIVSSIGLVNVIKNIILNVLSNRIQKKLIIHNIPTGILWGLIMSGKMDHQRVSILLPDMEKIANKRNAYLEILCHPGIVLESEMRPEYGPDDRIAFVSPNRDIEYEMILNRD